MDGLSVPKRTVIKSPNWTVLGVQSRRSYEFKRGPKWTVLWGVRGPKWTVLRGPKWMVLGGGYN